MVKPRTEALLIKVNQNSDYLEIYRDILQRRKVILVDTKSVRKTWEGHVLIELAKEAGTKVGQCLSGRLGRTDPGGRFAVQNNAGATKPRSTGGEE